MQVFFNLSRVGIDGTKWSKRKFYQHVTSYLETVPGAQFQCMLEAGTGWDCYKVLLPVADATAALAMRKHVEALCKQVSRKCRPYYFRSRQLDVDNIHQLSMFGLTDEEEQRFSDKAPAGTYRQIRV